MQKVGFAYTVSLLQSKPSKESLYFIEPKITDHGKSSTISFHQAKRTS